MAVPPLVSFDTDSVLGGATAQSSGATAWLLGARRCHRLALGCWAVPPPGSRVLGGATAYIISAHWLGSKISLNRSELEPNWPLLGL